MGRKMMAKKNLLAKAEVHANAGRVKEAEKICQLLLKKNPQHIEAAFLLSGVLMLEKRFQESEPLLRKVLAAEPNHVSAMNNLGVIYREHYKELQTAQDCFKKVIAANPAHFRALMNLGNIYCDLGQDEEGEACFKKALAVNPGSVESATFLAYLGNIAYRKRQFDEAIAHFEHALELSPNNTDILRNFLLARFGKGNKAAMVAMMEEVLKLPDAGRANFPIFSLAKRNCLWAMVEQTKDKVIALAKAGLADFSALEMSNLDLLAVTDIPYEDLLDVHRITGGILEGKRMRPPYTVHEKVQHHPSRMKIAYLSGDFRAHVINTFIRGLFNFHDRERFEIVCYSNTFNPDKTTEQYKNAADAFVDITGMTDVAVAERIYADGVQVLVNLAGYTKDSRMEVMAYRAAPVQIMYLGYPYTSGLSTVDYFISDPYLDGPQNAQYFVEKQLQLPESFATFDRLHEQEITEDSPFKANGHVTFGCLVNPYKLTPEVIAVWSQIMQAVPDSKIILNNPHYDFDLMRQRITEAFGAEGVADSRVTIIHEPHSSGVHLRYYNDIDIALDTFPLTGGTTTHEALWMGVPVVTLVGGIYPHRLSYSILSNAGMDLSEIIAFSKETYVKKAIALALNEARIDVLHREIPKHLALSIQCDPIRHTQHMEAAYRKAWNLKFPDRQMTFGNKPVGGEETPAHLLEKATCVAREGDLNQAKTLCRRIFKMDPENIEALNLFGSVHLIEKKYDTAKECLELVISVVPNQVNALNNLGLIYLECDRNFGAAETYFKKVLTLEPKHVNALMNLGNLYRALHQIESARASYKKALEIDPKNGALLNNLGSLEAKTGRIEEARAYYQQALIAMPDKPEILSNLITMHRTLGENEAALALISKAMSLPNPGAALFPMYNCAKMFCLWKEAEALLPKLTQLIGDGEATFDSFIELNLSLLSTPGIKAYTHFEIHQKTGQIVDQLREGPVYSEHPQAMRRTGRLKVGYLSPDFHQHVSNICFRGLMNFHNKDLFEVYCYSNSNIEDETSAQYRATADHFVNVTGLSDRELAAKIHADGIHFLIDLAGYTSRGRIAVLSYRPAPVQMMYLGYPYTSGLSSVDYFISDPFLDGSENAPFFTEKQLPLPQSFMSFSYLLEQPIDPVIPYEKNGVVTFGSMNNLYKLNPEVIRVWSQILKQVLKSKIIINHPNCSQEATRERITEEFKKNGVAPTRIRFISEPHASGSHFYHYNDMDIILDSFPLTGGTSTIDAVWMGLPVITWVGEIYPHRLSYSILKNIGVDVEDLIAFSEEEYVKKAVSLAKSPERIAAFHREIPRALTCSILSDPHRLTRQMESAFIQGWNQKFPEELIDVKIKEETVSYLPLDGGLDIAVKETVDDLETYVLKEQGAWFDPEYHFVQQIVQPGMRVLDFGAGIGSYAVPLAKKVGGNGKIWALTRSAVDAQFLYYSKGKNELNPLQVMIGLESHFDLDTEAQRRAFSKIDFVRIGVAESVAGLISRGARFFRENSPLVMFAIKSQDNSHLTGSVSRFKLLGYDTYRFVPGLPLLVPFAFDRELDGFVLNLFACKKDKADLLEKQGLLIQKIELLSELPGIQSQDWDTYRRALPYGTKLIGPQLNFSAQLDAWEHYSCALNLFAQSKDPARLGLSRYASLNASYGLLLMVCEKAPNVCRILSLIRVMIDLGLREAAVHLLNQIMALFESESSIELSEPFIAVSDEAARIDPGEHVGEWLFASVLKQREESRAFSTYFSGKDALPIFEAIQNTGFFGMEMEHQINLIRARFSLPAHGSSSLSQLGERGSVRFPLAEEESAVNGQRPYVC